MSMRWPLSTTELIGIRLVFLIQVRDHELVHVGADAARLVVARQELDGVGAGQQREAGVVFDRPLGELRGGRARQLDIDLVADVLRPWCRTRPSSRR